MSLGGRRRSYARVGLEAPTTLTIVTFVLLVVGFTVASLMLGSPEVNVGGTRPIGSIPYHLIELASIGALLGVISSLLYGRKRIGIVLLLPVLVISLDLDHLPIYLGVAQPIRPAHSLLFLFADVAVTALVVRRREFSLLSASAFMGHLAADSGIFPAFSPASFEYFPLPPIRLPLAAGSLFLALLAGRLMGRSGTETNPTAGNGR